MESKKTINYNLNKLNRKMTSKMEIEVDLNQDEELIEMAKYYNFYCKTKIKETFEKIIPTPNNLLLPTKNQSRRLSITEMKRRVSMRKKSFLLSNDFGDKEIEEFMKMPKEKEIEVGTFIMNKKPNARITPEILFIGYILNKRKYFNNQEAKKIRKELCRMLSVRETEENETIFQQGDNSDFFYIIISGKCGVFIEEVNLKLKRIKSYMR